MPSGINKEIVVGEEAFFTLRPEFRGRIVKVEEPDTALMCRSPEDEWEFSTWSLTMMDGSSTQGGCPGNSCTDFCPSTGKHLRYGAFWCKRHLSQARRIVVHDDPLTIEMLLDRVLDKVHRAGAEPFFLGVALAYDWPELASEGLEKYRICYREHKPWWSEVTGGMQAQLRKPDEEPHAEQLAVAQRFLLPPVRH